MMTRATNTEALKRMEKKEKAPPPVLQMLLSRKEWRQVIQGALHWLDVQTYAQMAFPETKPAWDPNETEG
jgi:hypothetical protein